MLLIGLASLVATALIPVVLWRLGAKQAQRDSDFLACQASLSQRQRRDTLLEIVAQSSDATYLAILWREIREYERADRDLLLARFRTNAALALPGTYTGVRVQDNLTDAVVRNYVDGLERRYTEVRCGGYPYPGLLDFIEETKRRGAKIDVSRIVNLVTGPTAEKQRPGHFFFQNLVAIIPDAASDLLRAVADIDPRAPGALRLNVLTGALLAVKDMGMERGDAKLNADEVEDPRYKLAEALAFLLHYSVLRSFDCWEREGATDVVSATVAWLIRAVGWVADTDSHLGKRMIENLSFAIQSIPNEERGWGVDSCDVRQGFEWIREKQPILWEMYGQSLELAATEVGPWNGGDGGND